MVRAVSDGFLRRQDPLRGPRPSRRWVGLDLGSRAIKLVEIEQTPAGPRLFKSFIQELPQPAGDQPVDKVGWLQSAIKEFSARDVHVSISGPEVAVRRVHMPLMSKRELAEAVKWQVKEQVPFSVQDAVLDVRQIGEVWEKDIKKQDVLVAAASSRCVEELISILERSGIKPASLVPVECATWRCVSTLLPETQKGSVVVVELGQDKTTLSVAKDGQLRLVRDVPVGCSTMTEALMGVVTAEQGDVTIDRARAEALTRRYGILSEETQGATDDGVPLFHLASLMRPVLERLLIELSRVFDFYKVQVDEAGVSRVLLCGAGANVKHLQAFLAEGLGVTVEVFNPLVRMEQHTQPFDAERIAEDGPRLAAAIGLALDHGHSLNLLPPRLRAGRWVLAQGVWLSAAKGLGAAALAVMLVLGVAVAVLQVKIRQQQRTWEQLEPAYRSIVASVTTCQQLARRADEMDRWFQQQPLWEGLLKEMAALLPPVVELDEILVDPEADPSQAMAVHLKGRVVSAGGTEEGSLAKFVDALERSPFFAQVELASSETHSGEAGQSTFTIDAVLE